VEAAETLTEATMTVAISTTVTVGVEEAVAAAVLRGLAVGWRDSTHSDFRGSTITEL
jgi:hypothetical protein